MTPLARRISSAVSTFCAPSEPLVSTRILTPISSAFFLRASSAIKVWAIPVGQAVTATTKLEESGFPIITRSEAGLAAFAASLSFALASSSACLASNIAATSSGVPAFISASMNSLSMSSLDKEARVRRCIFPAPSGAAIIKNSLAGSSSNEAKSTPARLLANTTVASLTAFVLA
ncbi:hypothetical protein D3C86_1633920 [compost metagenome]